MIQHRSAILKEILQQSNTTLTRQSSYCIPNLGIASQYPG